MSFKTKFFFLLSILLLSQGQILKAAMPKSRAVRLPPLFWYERDVPAQRTFKMALLLYWGSRSPRSSFTLLAPIYYQSKDLDESLRVILPFHFHTRSGDTSSTMWGPYFSKKTALSSTRMVVPFFWDYRPMEKTQQAYQLLFPFYFRTHSQDKASTYSTFFWLYRDPEVKHGLIPPYFWHKKKDKGFEVGFPLYWRFYNKDAKFIKDIQVAVPWFRLATKTTSLRSFFPIYWGQTSGEDSWNVFLPLLFHSKKANGAERTITPLFSKVITPNGKTFGHGLLSFYSNEPWGGKTKGFIPFFVYKEDPDYYWFRFLLYFVRKDNDGERLNTSLFPLFKYKRDYDRRQFLTPPAYFDWDQKSFRGYFANIFWKTDNEGNHKFVFFPLLWNIRTPDRKTTVIPPLMAFHHEGERHFSMVAPFYFRSQRGENILKVVPPFITRITPEKTWRGLFFLYWKTKKPGHSAVTLLPLYRRSKFPGGSSIYMPGFYHLRQGDETQGVAGIYLWDYRGKTQYNILPPLFWRIQRPTWKVKSLFPFYKYENESIRERGLFPLIAKTAPASTSPGVPKHFLADSHRVLPLYFYRNLEHGHDLWLPPIMGRFHKGINAKGEPFKRGRIFLLSSWEKTPSSYVNRLDPLYVYYKRENARGFMMPTAPFALWRYEVTGMDDEKNKLVQGAFFPYYWKKSFTFTRHLFIPIFYKSKQKTEDGQEDKSRKTWALTYYNAKNYEENKSMKLFFPLFFHRKNQDHSTSIFPPYWRERSEKLSRDVLFPVFFRSRDIEAQRKTFFIPGVWSSKDPQRAVTIAGLFFLKRDYELQEKFAVAFPLYWRISGPKRDLSFLFPLYFHHASENKETRVFFPVYWKFKDEVSDIFVFPPYFSVTSKAEKTKTSGVAPLWSTVRSTETKELSFQILGGLIGFNRDENGKYEFTLLYLKM